MKILNEIKMKKIITPLILLLSIAGFVFGQNDEKLSYSITKIQSAVAKDSITVISLPHSIIGNCQKVIVKVGTFKGGADILFDSYSPKDLEKHIKETGKDPHKKSIFIDIDDAYKKRSFIEVWYFDKRYNPHEVYHLQNNNS
jgi:hypothetical protein